MSADELTSLHRSGRVPAEFPRLPRLLDGATPDELARAGRLLAAVDPGEVLREHPGTPVLKAAVTGHGTLSGLVPSLTAELARHGTLLRPAVSDFDSYVFDLSDPEGFAGDADVVLCVLDHDIVTGELPVPWKVTDLERVLAKKVSLVAGLAGRFAAASRATLVLNTLPLPRSVPAQLVDHRSRALAGAAWREANARLLRLTAEHSGVVVVDLDPLTSEGVPVTDPRLSVYAKAHLAPGLLAAYAREVGHLARHLTGRGKKCLVLDLDDTVWGGILGEDGAEGIEVGHSPRGEAFTAFQRVAKQITAQGVLLAAVSKNDLEPVREVLRDHPGMVLREEDFVRVVANWRPKHDNLRELAADLNIGVDAFVFADDSPYERGLVRRELPGVAVVDLDREPAGHPGALLADGWFDTVELSDEDHARPARYRQEMARRDFLESFDSIEEYLRELGVTVRMARAASRELPRLSQITLRTNQFNLTTRRLQQADVEALAADPRAFPLAVHASDRMGDNGVVGAVFARRDGGTVHIDNFLLSCRVFSRGIEQACLAALLRHAKDTGAAEVRASYRPSAKNGKVKDFYPRSGFVPVAEDDGGTHFRHDLAELPEPPEHVRLTTDFEGTPS
ncbi:HAD-IIIC family phosphatase [Actinomadura litoris]|uniref:HAD-IIIC family phosphatase n=1 Tax=Actinomadura litoris TaxID=2678616 RepID=UPI001FA748D8|nr:HAD-IIIC family phosphatase [Actinomadura litoris]